MLGADCGRAVVGARARIIVEQLSHRRLGAGGALQGLRALEHQRQEVDDVDVPRPCRPLSGGLVGRRGGGCASSGRSGSRREHVVAFGVWHQNDYALMFGRTRALDTGGRLFFFCKDDGGANLF